LLKSYLIKNKDLDNQINRNITPKLSYFTAKQIATIYGFPQPQPNVVNVIGIISFGGGLFGTLDENGILTNGDCQSYWTDIGISPESHPIIKIVLVDNATNSPNDIQPTYENTLDVEMAGACCASASTIIIFYIAPNSDSGFVNVITTALDIPINVNGTFVKPSTISISWGSPEIYNSNSVLNQLNNLFKRASESGINIFVASGDNGSSDGIPNTINVDFPASSPYVISCGGTKLICPNISYDNSTIETTWLGSGGGFSKIFSMLPYQTSLNLNNNFRAVPDIAGVADPNTGVQFKINNKLYVFGGTSVVAPTYAGFIASLHINFFILPYLYTYTSTAFHDILIGNNGDYSATSGYDNTTGLGSLNGSIISPLIINTPLELVNVTNLTLSITLNLNINQTSQIIPTISPANASNKNITWTSSNIDVATVTNSGLITAKTNGTTTIIATTQDQNKTASIILTVITPAISITLNKTTLTLNPNQTFKLVSTITPVNASNKNITWTSSNINVATVSNTGLITAKSNGTTNIIATLEDHNKTADSEDQNKTAKVVLTVITPVTGITLNKTTLTLILNQTFKLIPTITPATASNKSIIWSSSNNSICTVINGTIKKIAKGSVIITAKTVDGNKTATVTIM